MGIRIVLFAAFFLLLCLEGCDRIPHEGLGSPAQSSYSINSTATDGTFLLDTQAGKVWHYSAKDEAFLEVPVTSKIMHYERGPDGKPRLVDPKNDPLDIR